MLLSGFDHVAVLTGDTPRFLEFYAGVFEATHQVIEEQDVLNILRIQFERQHGAYFPSIHEYAALYGISTARLRRARPDVLILHPGPMNRGVEIAAEVADGPHSVILHQVTNGVAVRMAVLYLLAGSKGA